MKAGKAGGLRGQCAGAVAAVGASPRANRGCVDVPIRSRCRAEGRRKPSMNRPEMDTMHVPDGDKELTDAISEAPAPSRVWLSQLAMVVLLAAGVYAVIRGAQQYPATADEVHHLQGKLAQGEA